MPQSAQKRSSSEYWRAQRGQARGRTSAFIDVQLHLFGPPVADQEAAHAGSPWIGDGADQVDGIGPVVGQVDVRLRGLGGARGVRVIDRRDLLAALGDLHRNSELVLRIDHVAQRARLSVARTVDPGCRAIAAGDHPAAFVGRLLERVGDDLVNELSGDRHGGLRLAACLVCASVLVQWYSLPGYPPASLPPT